MTFEIRSPKYESASITVPPEAAKLQKSFNGTICSNKGDEYIINNNIIDLLGGNPRDLSLVQRSNHWKVTAALYENIWRKRSLSVLTGEDFPIEKEQQLLFDWLDPRPDQLYLDIGCSTALYGRLLKQSESGCTVVSLDFSRPMLSEARLKARDDQADQYLLRADARHMPFYGATFGGLMMGGTLNELTDPLKVLFESWRVLKEGGTFFMMHLIKADDWYTKLLQSTIAYGGLTFWSLKESNQLFARAGFSVAEQFSKGIVCFTKLIPK